MNQESLASHMVTLKKMKTECYVKDEPRTMLSGNKQ